MSRVYIGLGSNIGDRIGFIQQALHFLSHHPQITVLSTSSFYETEPVGYKDQEWFVNAVVSLETEMTPYSLLRHCQMIEQQLGRIRDPQIPDGPRTIDLDILFFDSLIQSDPELSIPHPRFHERAYALVPMLEIGEDHIHPIFGQSMIALHQALEAPEEVYLYGTREALNRLLLDSNEESC
ncbi:MAG: 2-amino-4-hydroxy-6-hydroxymethyldihydropteridine diphosphokinase [Cyanobacteria bacterium]|nr:2-amino-4-hydroxy-6-hydroxymethyldihydropteridine diphosphokinase [Cyanobacteriota bacterium]